MAGLAFNNIGNGFELSINENEKLAIVGASGSGKSRVLRIAAGIERMNSGDIELGGASIAKVPAKKRDVALVSPDAPMKATLTAYKAMAADAKRLGRGDIDRRVRDAAEKLGISSVLERKLKDISEGERRLVALGRAISAAPKAYLLDDVCAGMDAALRARVMNIIRALDGVVVYATCSISDALMLGGRIAVMENGKAVQIAEGREVAGKPANTAAAQVCGVNLVSAKLTPRDSRMYAVIGDISLRVPDLTVKKLKSDIYIGKEIVLGIRPETVSADEEFVTENFGTAFEAAVESAVFMGSHTDVTLNASGTGIHAYLCPKADYETGSTIKVAADPAGLLMFDASTGENILF